MAKEERKQDDYERVLENVVYEEIKKIHRDDSNGRLVQPQYRDQKRDELY